ncbi:replication initiation protein, partial [Enterococcus faecium]|uniref:replication initiation protein n=3 Tax=Enterococcus faecium TaxID=1352 RepID=UPI001E42A76C
IIGNPSLNHRYRKGFYSLFKTLQQNPKTLFRLLMQYRSTGYYVVRIEEFRSLMDIPEYYQMGNIDQKVLNPALRELKKYFNDLKVTKIKAKKGNKIAKLEFTFSSLTSDLPKISLRNWLEE